MYYQIYVGEWEMRGFKFTVVLLLLVQFFLIVHNDRSYAEENVDQSTTIDLESTENQLKFLKITEDSAEVYIKKNGSLTAIAKLVKDQEYKFYEEQEDWFVIDIGGTKGYVKKEFAQASDGQTIKNPVDYKDPLVQVSLIKDVMVYESETKQNVIATLLKGEVYSVFEETDTGYYMNIGGRKGFIDKTDLIRDFLPSDQFFKVITQKQPVYVKRSGKLIQKGYMLEGQEFKRIKGADSWHLIRYGNEMGYVKMQGTIPSDGRTFKPSASSNVQVYFTTLQEVHVYSEPSLNSSSFAVLPKNETYPIFSRQGEWYVIQYGGRIGYVHPKLAKTNYMDVVRSNTTYTYDQMKLDIEELVVMYPGLVSKKIIGKSVDGRDIYAIKLGRGTKEIMINASHHAREHMTTNVVMEMVDQYALSAAKGTNYGGYNTRQVLSKVSIWFVPMVNPDGVTLVQKGYTSAKNPAYVLKLNGGKKDFSSWKANIRGVDLNRQYPVNWQAIRGPKRPAPENFKGYKPLSEPEVLALVNFTRNHSFKTTVSYHSSGQILFWYYGQKGAAYKRDYNIAKQIRSLTGYSLVDAKLSSTSGGGYKDWFITEMKMPGFTPEIAPYVGKRPVPNSYFPSIWKQNNRVGLMLANEAAKR